VGRGELGIEHALAAGDSDQAAALLAASVMRTYLGGHADLLGRWLREIGEATFERNPGPALIASLVYAMFGMPVESEHLARIAQRAPAIAPADEPMWHMVKSMLAHEGSLQAHADARAAVDGEPEWGAWRMFGLYCLSISSIMVGDAPAADLQAATAVEAAGSGVGTAPFFGLAIQSSLAIERGDWASATILARRSHDAYDRTGLGDVVTAILVHAVAARVAIHAGDVERARQELVHAQVARVTASRAAAAASVLAQLEIARAYLALADPAGARQVMSEAAAILRLRPDLGLIGARVAALRSSLEHAPHALAGASTLTAAELRVLPALSTPLSFKEIGERLFLSPHTIKTHAMSIYGKLDASSRSEAVERAIELGLLDPFPRVPARRPADVR
jgi:LuxR family maltose regulon positive regulatory protein